MSKRRHRIARLRDIADRQEKAARLQMAQSEISVRGAREAKAESLRRTEEVLHQDLPGRFREAVFRASLSSSQRQDAVIGELVVQLERNISSWQDRRQRAGSFERLYDRIERQDRLEAQRVAERELGDIVNSRIAARTQTNAPVVRS